MISILEKVKNRINRYLTKYPKRVQCNLCNWQSRRLLSDSWHPHTICPNCGSQVRHRLLVAAMTTFEQLSTKSLVKNKKVLHFAPEPLLSTMFACDASEYLTADLLRDDVSMNLDISDMRPIEDNSFDLIIACDVLEHVSNDIAAIKEVFRALNPKGWAIFTVPQKDGLGMTYEDPAITTDEARLKAFGQEDHVRIYGNNFPDILESHNFVVTTIDERDFNEEKVKKNVLFPPILSSNPLATNYRKVFFAQKLS